MKNKKREREVSQSYSSAINQTRENLIHRFLKNREGRGGNLGGKKKKKRGGLKGVDHGV